MRYAQLLKGLDITVLKLSQVRDDNEKFRFDAGYFAKLAILTEARIEALPHLRLGAVCSVFRKGIFDIKAVSYTKFGVPFVRISNLRDGLIDSKDLTFIPREVHAAEKKTALQFGDIVLSKTAYAAASFVNLAHCNVSQDTIAVKLSSEGGKKFKSGYIVAYLNSIYGLALMNRQFQGNVQTHLSLPDGGKIVVPLLGQELQKAIDNTIRDANEQLRSAHQQLGTATRVLTATLGLSHWHPAEPLTYTRRSSAVFAARRLDSQYFTPRVAELLSHLGSGGQSVRDVAEPRRERFTPSDTGTFRYMEISDIFNDGSATTAVLPMREAPSRATWYIRKGDVVTSTVRPNRRLSALISPEQDGCVASSGLVVLQPRRVPAEVLLTYLRLPVFCELMDLHTSASLYPAISDADLLALPFPQIKPAAINSIVSAVSSAHTRRNRAQYLLMQAKHSVDIAIEKSESTALKYLKES